MVDHKWEHLAKSKAERDRLASGAEQRAASGESISTSAMTRYRARRKNGTRMAMDWKYSLRGYVMGVGLWAFVLISGLDLFHKNPLWQRISGVALIITSGLVALAVLRWLFLPVDDASAQALQEYHESMKWRNIWKDGEGTKGSG